MCCCKDALEHSVPVEPCKGLGVTPEGWYDTALVPVKADEAYATSPERSRCETESQRCVERSGVLLKELRCELLVLYCILKEDFVANILSLNMLKVFVLIFLQRSSKIYAAVSWCLFCVHICLYAS